jgi:hypothetical protein
MIDKVKTVIIWALLGVAAVVPAYVLYSVEATTQLEAVVLGFGVPLAIVMVTTILLGLLRRRRTR